MTLSKNKIKFIHSLELKKNRKESNLFVAEGNKLVNDNLSFMKCECLVAMPEWYDQNPHARAEEMITASKEELKKVSFLKTPQEVLGVFRQPEYLLNLSDLKEKLTIVLDSVQDPGNLGTIIRLADWFGIENIVCSNETVDCYNPKTVQATMGAIARIKIHYTPLVPFFQEMKDINIYGTFLEGENIYNEELTQQGLIVMGNEGNGISHELRPYINKELHIPSYPAGRPTSESLNVAIATAIICSEFRRNG